MKLQYLGTAAAEAWPAMFCTCDACKRAKAQGGRNIRTRSQAIIDGKILIDFPSDTYQHMMAFDIDLPHVGTCLMTHTHRDHFYPEDILNRVPGFFYPDEDSPALLHFYGSERVVKEWDRCKDRDGGTVTAQFHEVKAFETFYAEGYKITPLPGDHDPGAGPLMYIIEKDGKTLLYAHDTGYLLPDVWDYFKKTGICFDFVSLDCTGGLGSQYRHGHMGTVVCTEVRDRMVTEGYASGKTVFCLHHFSHNSKFTYDETVGPAKELGFLVSYDGMTVDV